MAPPLFVLLHSPLVGPSSWLSVARRLHAEDLQVIVPKLTDHPTGEPYWSQHAACVVDAVPARRRAVVVAHSGAGPLVPEIVARLSGAAACVFVDALLYEDGACRLDLLAEEDADMAGAMKAHLLAGGEYPEWTDEDLAGLVPDQGDRAELLRELTPRDLEFFMEPIPAPELPPGTPCAYLQLTATYGTWADRAEAQGWRVDRLDVGHFHPLVAPDEIAAHLMDLTDAVLPRRPDRTDRGDLPETE